MSNPTTCLIALGVTLGAAGLAVRWHNIRLYPIGVGFTLPSPDAHYLFTATTYLDKQLVGPDLMFYRSETHFAATGQLVASRQYNTRPYSDDTDFRRRRRDLMVS